MSILIGILVIGSLIAIHEFGHFIAAKMCGVGVLQFAIGFGPTLIKFSIGETEYSLRLIPLGGYVRMVGDIPDVITGKQETDEEVRNQELIAEAVPIDALSEVVHDRSKWFIHKSTLQKCFIVFAGPLANLILAVVLPGLCAYRYGEQLPDERAILGKIAEGGPAYSVGLKEGDIVSNINGTEIKTWSQLAKTINESSSTPIEVSFKRGDTENKLLVTPESREFREFSGERKTSRFIGIFPSSYRENRDIFGAVKFGILWCYDKVGVTLAGLTGLMFGLVSHNDLSGPIRIVQVAAEQADRGFEQIFFFTAILSVSLAVLNLMPIPILDGGHLVFFLLEAIIGPISIRKREIAQNFGMALLLMVMLFAFKNDITHLFKTKPANEWEAMKDN